jgi:alpha-L-fucosidase
MVRFRKYYWNLHKTFNPKKFNPDVWAEAAWNAGMRYIVMVSVYIIRK